MLTKVTMLGLVSVVTLCAQLPVGLKTTPSGYVLSGQSGAQTVTLANTTGAAIAISSIAATGANAADFAVTNNCGTSLAANATCTISIVFTASSTAAERAVLAINSGSSPATPAVSVSPTSLTFSGSVGSTTASQTVSVRNSGTGTASITGVTLSGTNASSFSLSNGCGSTLASGGATCSVGVTFTPASAGSFAATLNVADNASGSPQTVGLSGTGSGYSGNDPPTNLTFSQAIAAFTLASDYEFGTGSGRNITNTTQLAAAFGPYGIAGTSTINNEWEVYQTFSSAANFVFNANSLALTATCCINGTNTNAGVVAGNIASAQVTTNNTFVPGVTGATVYAFETSMQIPNHNGTWAANWLYAKNPSGGGVSPSGSDGSEIDNPEIYQYQTGQNTTTWTEHEHFPSGGTNTSGGSIYSIETSTNSGTTSVGGNYTNGTDYSGALHLYQTLWTPDAVYKYIDGTLIEARHFVWTSGSYAQNIVNLAVGSTGDGNLQPNSYSEFPFAIQLDHIKIWTH